MSFAAMMLVGLLIDAAFGWPDQLFRRIGHPVTWIGTGISMLEERLNSGTREQKLGLGAACVLLVILSVAIPALMLQVLVPSGPLGWVLGGVLAWPFLAARSMHDHVKAVADPLAMGNLAEARHAVSMIVGRDPEALDGAGIARAAMESLAENTSDGIIAPLFWGVIAGLPGIAIYKAINTMDSMIGHRNARYEAFGKAAARLDDVVNLVPARLTGLLFALGSGRKFQQAFLVMRRDAPRHRSPNAGWPEGAMAAALGIRLSGPRIYGDRVAQEPWLNAEGRDPDPVDLVKALSFYRRNMTLTALVLLALALL